MDTSGESLSSLGSVAALMIFFIVIVAVVSLVVRPTDVQLPQWLQIGHHRTIHLSYAWTPVLGAVLMLAFRCLTFEQVWYAVKGTDNIKPYGIVILFMSLAYMSYSLESTGGLAWLALHITNKSEGNGRSLFIFYYTLTAVLTSLTSNDIVIMTITPIILHFAKATGAEPLPFLVCMFSSAHLWSMMLVISNPTNIIAGDAFNMTFLEYTKWMALPTLVCGVFLLGLLYWRFCRQIPAVLQLPEMHPNEVLKDKLAAVVGSVLLLSCIAMLAASTSIGWEMWPITLVFAGLHTSFNLVTQVLLPPGHSYRPSSDTSAASVTSRTQSAPQSQQNSRKRLLRSDDGCSHSLTVQATMAESELQLAEIAADVDAAEQQTAQQTAGHHDTSALQTQTQELPMQQYIDVWLGLPWEIVPFVLGMFVLVEGLAVNDWVDTFARWLSQGSNSTGSTVFLVGSVSTVLANVVNNQPMTILMSRVCLSPAFSGAVSERSLLGALFALVTASNLGANVTVIGALAGIMWASILRRHGVNVGYVQFTQLVSLPGIVCIFITLLLLWIELLVF